jgi:hypothetical protein
LTAFADLVFWAHLQAALRIEDGQSHIAALFYTNVKIDIVLGRVWISAVTDVGLLRSLVYFASPDARQLPLSILSLNQ